MPNKKYEHSRKPFLTFSISEFLSLSKRFFSISRSLLDSKLLLLILSNGFLSLSKIAKLQ